MKTKLLTERLSPDDIAEICAEYGVPTIYHLPAQMFDALCAEGEAERMLTRLRSKQPKSKTLNQPID